MQLNTSTTIGGNLSLQNIASGVSMHQVCATKVAWNLAVYANATPVQIGSQDSSCPGNSFGKNGSVTYDTAATGFYNNKVAKNLSCSNNTSISGGGNNAQKKLGQCLSF
jgi:hypothetical protein